MDNVRFTLRQIDFLYSKLSEGLAYCQIVTDDAGKPVDWIYLDVNSAYETINGVKKEDVVGKRATMFLPALKRDPADWISIYGKVALTGEPISTERFAAVRNKWFHISAYSPQPGYFISIFEDITKRKQAEEALLKSEARFHTTMDDMLEGCQIIGFDWRYIYINDAAQIHNRRPKEELLGKRYMDMWPGIESTHVFTLIKRCMEERASQCLENEFVYPDGAVGWFDLRIDPVPEGIFILSIDITERKKAEMALKETLEKASFQAALIRNASVAVGVGYLDGRLGMVNQAFEELTGYSEKELQTISWNTALTPPEYRQFESEKLEELQRNKQSIRYEKEYIRKDGSRVPIELTVNPFFDKEGNVTHYFSFITDITDRKQAEEALVASERRYHDLFTSMNEIFQVFSLIYDETGRVVDYRILDVNPAFEKLVGKTREQLVDKQVVKDLWSVEDYWLEQFRKVRQTGKPIRYENYGAAFDKYYEVFVYRLSENQLASIATDITERKKAEEALKTTLNRFYTTLTNMQGSILLVSADGHVEFANQSFCDYFNIEESPAALKGLSAAQIMDKIRASYLYPERGLQRIEEIVAEKKLVVGEEIPMSDGRTCLRDFIPLSSDGGAVSRLWHHMDITKQKNTEETMRKLNETLEERVRERTLEVANERQRLYTVLETLPPYIVLLDKDYQVAFANKVFRGLFGESRGRPCFEFLFKRDSPCENCETYKVLKNNKPHHWEWTGPNGRDYDIYDFPFVDTDGSTMILEMGLDITNRKDAEAEVKKYQEHLEQLVSERTEALRESEQRWATTLSSIGDAVIATDTEGKVTFMNAVAEKLTGWALKDSAGKPIKQVFHIINQKSQKEVENPVARVLVHGVIVGLANHTILIRKDGTEVPIDDSGAPIISGDGLIRGVVLVFRDITERKKTEDALQRQATLIDLSPDAIIVRKVDGTITFWSKGAEKLYGWNKNEAIGKSTHELLKTQFPKSFKDIVSELKTKHEWTGEVIQYTKDGQAIAAQSWWLTEKTEHDEIISILESNVDLTELKKAEREIARLATFPTLNPNPIVEVDFGGKITYANPATKLLFPDLIEAGLNHVFFFNWEKVRETFDDKSTNAYSREVKINDHWYQQQFYLVPKTEQIRIYTSDIDELKQTEEARAHAQSKLEENAMVLEEYASQMEELAEQRAQQLRNTERLAAIGQTAGMVGHDIRNPLQAITSDIYIISEEIKDMREGEGKQAILESIESVNQNLTYINKIVSDLQDYTRPLKPNIQPVDLVELIKGTILTFNVPKDIKVTTAVKAQLISTDIAYMRRILTNLITNAIQAMTNGGKLTVKTSRTKDHIVITIQDTGVGIPQDAVAKMFTPLFTTKSKGQGLGLAVVKRLVDALGGTITFESQQNAGTKFILHFPPEAPEEHKY